MNSQSKLSTGLAKCTSPGYNIHMSKNPALISMSSRSKWIHLHWSFEKTSAVDAIWLAWAKQNSNLGKKMGVPACDSVSRSFPALFSHLAARLGFPVAEESKWPENSESTYHTGFWFGSIVKIHVKIWGDFSENGVYYHPPTLPNFATFYRDNDDESDLEVFPWILQTNPNSCCCMKVASTQTLPDSR